MRFETPKEPREIVMSLIFDPQDVPILFDIAKPYQNINREYSTDYSVIWASTIILDSMEACEENNTALRIDLDSEEYPMFINRMNEDATKYMNEQLAFWQVITTRYPGWLLTKNVIITQAAAIKDQNEMHDPFIGIDLAPLERKLKHAFEITKTFRQISNNINR